MNQNIWCRFFSSHKYEIIKEENLTDNRGNIIGKVFVSRCTNCGTIKQTIVHTEI